MWRPDPRVFNPAGSNRYGPEKVVLLIENHAACLDDGFVAPAHHRLEVRSW